MSVLSTIQQFCKRTNVPSPTTVLGNPDTQVNQVLGILEEIGNDMAKRGSWEGLTNEATITTLAAEDQGTIVSYATNGFRNYRQGTFWDRTNKLPILGPLSDSDWQTRKALTFTGPRYQFRFRGGHILVNPTPTAGYTWVFEYASKNWMLGIDGTTYKQYATLDSDTILIPEDVLLLGLRWSWKKEKGFDYAEDFATYENQIKDSLANDGGKKTLTMDDSPHESRPGIFVPDRSWSV